MSDVKAYIGELYSNSEIVKKDEFEKGTSFKFYCPVIDDSVAGFLDIFLKCNKPMKILELGTSIGYSTTILAKAAKSYGGVVTTVEKDKRVASAAQENFEKYGVSDSIQLIQGDAFEVVETLKPEYDLVFLDIYNGLYPDIMEQSLNLLKPNGIMIADDTLFPVVRKDNIFEESNKKVNLFNELIAKREDVDSYLVPLDDGITIVIKK